MTEELPPGTLAWLCARYALQLMVSVAVLRLYLRAGYHRAWALLALSPLVAAPIAWYAVLRGYAYPEEAEWSVMPFVAAVAAMLLRLAFSTRRRGEGRSPK